MVGVDQQWPEIFRMTGLLQACTKDGIPKMPMYDNRTHSTTAKFMEFSANDIKTSLLTDVLLVQENYAEQFLDTFKRNPRKPRGERILDQNLHTFLLSYRSTLNSTLDKSKSPATRMQHHFNQRHGTRRPKLKHDDPFLARSQGPRIGWTEMKGTCVTRGTSWKW